MTNLTISEGCAVMSVEARKKELPFLVTWYLMGAKVHKNWKGKKDAIALELNGDTKELALSDFDLLCGIADKVSRRTSLDKVVSAKQALDLCRLAMLKMEYEKDPRSGLKGVVMLKDKGGCGYWRMILPARYMDKTGLYIDITASSANFDCLAEYDTVYVQRTHDWESYYMLEKLKAIGKRIVYDIDDDIFNITPDNPVFAVIGRDQQMAAVACMKLADVVVTTTDEMQSRLGSILEGKIPTIIPNALNPDDGWQPTPLTGSPDGIRRIFWQGSPTHAEDWMECAEAVDQVMEQTKDVRLVILGFLPPIIQSFLNKPYWRGRVEFMAFNDPETYFQMLKHIRAEVGIAPLRNTVFNGGKSSIKFLEYTLAGMPTVASGCKPYSEVIEDGEDGFLAYDTEDWFTYIMSCLNDKGMRLGIIEKAREKARLGMDIRETAKMWREVLIP